MSDLAHERDRLIALVDQWIADREQDDVTDARVDQAALVALVAGDDEDGDEIEGVYSLRGQRQGRTCRSGSHACSPSTSTTA